MIYLIVDRKNRVCKIGYSKNPLKRLGQLQTGNPEPLMLVSTIDGDINTEKELHKRFGAFRVNGEWFLHTEEIDSYFGDQSYFKVSMAVLELIQTTMTLPEIKLLAEIVLMYCGRGIFYLRRGVRQEIGVKLKINIRTIDNAITKLTQYGLLIRVSPGYYRLSEEYFQLP